MSSLSPTRRAWLLLVLVTLIWGCNWPVMKIGVAHMPPLWFGVYRSAIGMGAAVVLLAALGRLRRPPVGDWPVIISNGLLQQGLFVGLINLGLMLVPAGRSAVLAYTTPLWVMPAASFFLHESLSPRRLVGVAVGMTGLLVLFNPLSFDWSNHDGLIGNGFLLLAALLWAINIVHIRAHRFQASPLELMPAQLGLSTLVLLVLAVIFEGAPRLDLTWASAAVLLYTGIAATALAVWAVTVINRDLPAITSSLAMLSIPVMGVVSSTLVLGDSLSFGLLAALGLMIGGLVLAARS